MCVFSSSKKADEKYAEVIPRMVRLLNVLNEDRVSHIRAQEAIVVRTSGARAESDDLLW